MKTLVLDSSPGVPIGIPSDVHFNVAPAFKPRAKGQPILGHNSVKFAHFVPMGEAGHHVKKLLDIDETQTGPTEATEGYGELLKAEKLENPTHAPTHSSTLVPDGQFERDAKTYMELPKKDRVDTFETPEDIPAIKEKNTSSLATVISAAQRTSSPRVPQVKKSRKKPAPKSKKKKATAKKKMTSFRILKRKK